MTEIVKVDYFCPKCKKTLFGNLKLEMSTDMFTEEEKKRVQAYFLNMHNNQKHSRCMNCSKKILVGVEPKENWGIRIVGKTFNKPERPEDSGFRIWTGIFCKECLEKIDKRA